MAKKRRSKRRVGLLLRLVSACGHMLRWLVRHPQPLLVLGLIVVVSWILWDYALRADAFRITQVVMPEGANLELREPLIGKNIWVVDIQTLAKELKRQRPSLKQVRVIRQLPATLRIEPVERVAVAQLRLDHWYLIDQEGFILPYGQGIPFSDLTRFTGIKRPDAALSVGVVNHDEKLSLALRILALLLRHPVLLTHRLSELDVADEHQIRFILDEVIEVRCGSEAELEAHLGRLRASLRVMAGESLDNRYIDVRFQEPIVGSRRP